MNIGLLTSMIVVILSGVLLLGVSGAVQAADGSWVKSAELIGLDTAANDRFGESISISGDTAIVGAPYDDDTHNASGSAYIFVRANGVWTQQAKLTASDAAEDNRFGSSVSISGDTAVIGAPSVDDVGQDSGLAYVFVKPPGGWANATEDVKLRAIDAVQRNWFGNSVSISGNTIIVGAQDGDNRSPHAAYIFTRDGGTWTQQAKLTASDTSPVDWFGHSVSISGNTAIIGAPYFADAAQSSGSAYIFVKPSSGWTYATEDARLTASDASGAERFGYSVSISENTAIVGAFHDSDSGVHSGSAYIFVKPSGGWTNTTENAKLTASDAAQGDEFGTSVSISENRTMVGAPAANVGEQNTGSAYIFVKSESGWTNATEDVKLPSPNAAAVDEFGHSLSLNENTAVVGAPAANGAGSVYVYVDESAQAPDFEWIRQFGSAGPPDLPEDSVRAVDSDGNIYVAGHVEGTLPGETHYGGRDAFVCKHDARDGTQVWCRQSGSAGADNAYGIAVYDGDVYVVGGTDDIIHGTTNFGANDAFVRRYNSEGEVIWTDQFGTGDHDFAIGIDVDSSGIYIVGNTNATLPGQTSQGGISDGYIRKYDFDKAVRWTKQFGTPGEDEAVRITVDNGISYVTGYADDAFDGKTNYGLRDVYVRKYDTDGNHVWTSQYGGPANDVARDIVTDLGNVYVAGVTEGTMPEQFSRGGRDAFISRLDAKGDEVWTRQFGSSEDDAAFAIDAYSGELFVSGYTNGILPTQSSAGGADAYVRKYNPDGSSQWTHQFGSAGRDLALAVSVDSTGIYVGGSTDGILDERVSVNGVDAFIAKVSAQPLLPCPQPGPWTGRTDQGYPVELTVSDTPQRRVSTFDLYAAVSCSSGQTAYIDPRSFDPVPIINRHFDSNVDNMSISGDFDANTNNASGDWSIEFDNEHFGHCEGSVTWNASMGTESPFIAEVRPNQGLVGLPNDISIYGGGFMTDTVATMGVQNLQATYVDATHLRAVVPADMPQGVYDVTVSNPNGGSASLPKGYTVYAAGSDDLYRHDYELWVDTGSARAGAEAKLGLVVYRQGGKSALSDAIVRFYLGNPDAGGTSIGDGRIPLLSPRSSSSTSAVAWTPPQDADYEICAVIDPDDAVAEAREDNNVVCRTVTALPPAADQLAPHVDDFQVDDSALATGGMTVTLDTAASDPLPGSGVVTLLHVEYEYSQAADQWVPVQDSDWLDYDANRDNYPWRLIPSAGVKYLYAWASDGAGNISLFPYQGSVNHALGTETILPNQGRIYRHTVEAGQQVTARLESISGDADLYVWAPDHETRPPWVSNLTGGIDQVSFVAPLAGVYQIEVYGYTDAQYRLQVEVTATEANAAQLHPGAKTDKAVLSQPLVPVASVPGNHFALSTPPLGNRSIFIPSVNR